MSRDVVLRLLGVSLLPALLACEPAKQTPPKNVKVTVVAILASQKGTHIDPRLKQIAAEVRKRKRCLTSFKIGWMGCKSLPVNQPTSFKLVENQEVRITIHHGADQRNRVELAVKAPRAGEITYRTVCGKFFPIVTRYQTEDQQRLILAIRVQPCNGGN